MADFANALVKFKIKPEFKEAFKLVFERMNNEDFDYLDYGFNHITTEGQYIEEYDEDYDYLPDTLRVGCNYNLEGEFSEERNQEIDGDIVTLGFSAKWMNVDSIKHSVAIFMDYVADEILFFEIIGIPKLTFSSHDCGDDECYHKITYEGKLGEWGFEFKEISKVKLKD